MEIAATVSGCCQVAQDVYRDIHTTKIFDCSTTINEILDWARKTKNNENLSICEIQLSTIDND